MNELRWHHTKHHAEKGGNNGTGLGRQDTKLQSSFKLCSLKVTEESVILNVVLTMINVSTLQQWKLYIEIILNKHRNWPR